MSAVFNKKFFLIGLILLAQNVSAVMFECESFDGETLYSDLPCPVQFEQISSDQELIELTEFDKLKMQSLQGNWLLISRDGEKVNSEANKIWHFEGSDFYTETGGELSETYNFSVSGLILETDIFKVKLLDLTEKYLTTTQEGSKIKFRKI